MNSVLRLSDKKLTIYIMLIRRIGNIKEFLSSTHNVYNVNIVEKEGNEYYYTRVGDDTFETFIEIKASLYFGSLSILFSMLYIFDIAFFNYIKTENLKNFKVNQNNTPNTSVLVS